MEHGHLTRLKNTLIPLALPYLRALRAANNDARTVAKANFAAAKFATSSSAVGVQFIASFGIDCLGLDGSEFGEIVDAAMLQL